MYAIRSYYVSKKNLNWFWQSWYFQNGGIPDLAITKVVKDKNKFSVTVENKGDIPIPAVISFYNGDKLVKTITNPAVMWQNNKQEIVVTYEASETITSIKLGSAIIPDSNRGDNEYEIK